jgi:hypothetical protein
MYLQISMSAYYQTFAREHARTILEAIAAKIAVMEKSSIQKKGHV